ncbi:MAG TPA: hypothetical protein VFS43_21445 [Polyangiaceae bacterium]|nr:hypothetical protein [Polyangiaceae bacterium]
MAPHDPRGAYRDELNAARLRIELLESELAAKRAGEAGGGRALDEARARAFELEARAGELEARVRELEKAAAERARRSNERANERRAARSAQAPEPPPAAEEAPTLVWSLLGLVTLAALAVLASGRIGAPMALVAVVVGSAASHAFFGWLAGRTFGRRGRDGWQERGAQAVPAPRPGARGVVRPAGPPPRPRSPFSPPPSSGRGTRTRFTAKRGRD